MKAGHFDPSALETLRARIQSTEGLEAFDRLVEYGAQCPTLECAPGGRGKVHDFRYTSTAPRGWPFAFTVSRAHLLFQVRALGARTLHLTKTQLARRIEVVRKGADSQFQIVVRNRREADVVVELLLSRWPATQAAAERPAPGDDAESLRRYRSALEAVEGACRVTGVMDRRHLRAVHIKSGESCSEVERLDGHNGLLLSPHVAHLFERGYISFADDGQVLVARQLNSTVLKRWSITLPITTRSFLSKQKRYLAWHRENVFEKAEAGRRRKD
jgi:hypothetical protein